MLKELYVKDFILIDEVHICMNDTMSAFTGETGAGKSLLMDAIGILKGERFFVDMIRQGCNKAFIEGVFTCSKTHPVIQLLYNHGYEVQDDMIIITREVSQEGKSYTRLNQRMISVSFLKEIMNLLIDIHSQHDTHQLLNSQSHGTILDTFLHDTSLLKDVKNSYKLYQKQKKELDQIMHQDYTEDDLEFFTYQLNEIDETNIKENELDELQLQLKQLQSFEKTYNSLQKALYILQEQQGITTLYEASKQLQHIQYDETIQKISDQFMDLYYTSHDIVEQLKDYSSTLSYDEEQIQQIQDRIQLIQRIYRKYGGSYDAVMEKRNLLERQIDSILYRQDAIKKHEDLCKQAYDDFVQISLKLRKKRKTYAKKLEHEVSSQLKDLELTNAKFKVDFEEIDGNSQGMDKIQFLVSMNKGEVMKNLSATASGGELSRFMLGLKCVMQRYQSIETVIFDEIDTGVSGKVAFAIGKKMQEISSFCQVFCVTHSPAVAACAKHQYLVEKQQDHHHTITSIRELNESQRIEFLALLSSNSTSTSALQAAKELLHEANK